MPQLIRSIENILREKKSEICILRFFDQKNQSKRFCTYEEDCELNSKTREDHLKWFEERGIHFEIVSPESLICGWNGQYYVDIDEKSLKEYCQKFEDGEGKSLEHDKYQMFICEYDESVEEKIDYA